MSDQLTTAEAAKILKITTTAVRSLIDRGHLTGVRFGRDWMIDAEAVRARMRAKVKGKLSKGGYGMHKGGRPKSAE